jgi:CheY-like chemotaxis protein
MQLESAFPIVAKSPMASVGRVKLRALVADSSEEIRRRCKDDLVAADPSITVLEAVDGPSALDVLKRESIDLCLIDRTLPRVDGHLLVQQVQQPNLRTVFVLLSDKLVSSWPEIASQVRAYEVLLKPPGHGRVDKLLGVLQRMKTAARVLIALENPAAAVVVVRMFEAARFTLVPDVVERADVVLRRIEQSYDFVLLDMTLPDMTGIEVAARIRERDPRLGIIMTGREALPAESFLRQLSVSAYLRQPFDTLALENALHKVFGLWQPYLQSALMRSRARASSRGTP